MRLINRVWIMVVLMVLCAGCNLSKTEVAAVATDTSASIEAVTSAVTEAATPRVTRTPIPFGTTVLPTLLPLPGNIVGIVVNTPQATLISVTSAPPLGSVCQIYTTYSGVDPRNSLSLRTTGKITAPQVFRVPTNAQVLLVPSSQEVEGDGYHWLNVIYVDPSQTRYQGWMARDSFSANGVRDPSIATLRPIGASAGC